MPRTYLRSVLALAGILITIGGCAENPSASVRAEAPGEWQKIRLAEGPRFSRSGSDASSALIGPGGGSLQAAGHKLVFPKGALSEPTVITMTADPEYVGVELQPHGLQFPAGRGPVLTLDMDGAEKLRFSRFAVAYFGEAGEILEVLPTTSLGMSGELRSRLQHFSKYSAVAE